MDFFLVSPEMSVDVNDSQKHEESGPYRGFGSANSYVNANSMYSDIRESNFHYTALDIDKLRIGDEEIVQKAVCGIQDPHSNTKRPGELLASNISSPKPRKRSVSSMSMTPRRNKSPEESTKKGYSSFQRSLKLLGLQPEDFGINNKINTSCAHTSSYRVEPTFHTRLTKRSSSLENLRSAALSHMADGRSTPGEHLDRRILSNAVYEEWYFQKLEEARRKKKAQELNDQKKEEHFEKVKAEQKQKAEENFNEWKILKNKQRQQWKQQQQQGQKKLENKAGEDSRLRDGTKVRRNQEEVFLAWKKEKDKLLKQRKLKQKIQKETVKPDNDKNAAAEMTFKLWKKQADETLKEKAQEEKRRKQEEEEAKKEKERVKRESAEASFCAWKKKKDSELKKKMREDRLAEEQKKSAKLIREAERLYEAEQIFQEWLDQVEERQSKEIDYVQKRKEKNLHQFPWNPGGSVHW